MTVDAMTVNLNDEVKVILTEIGAKILNKREDYFSRIIPNYEVRTHKKGESYETQLWCLFEIFGEYTSITCKPFFESNEIDFI